MRIPRTLLFLYLIIAASLANAQQFKVLIDNLDYKLMEVDSGYYVSHGMESKEDLILDTSIIKKKNGILRLPLLNGKTIEFKDTLDYETDQASRSYFYLGEIKKKEVYIIQEGWHYDDSTIMIDKRTGMMDTLWTLGKFSSYPLSNVAEYYFYPQAGTHFAIYNLITRHGIFIVIPMMTFFNFDSVKWLNENSFLCKTEVYDPTISEELILKYFLVEIKK